MRCAKCGNAIPNWAQGVCYRCVQIDKDRKRYGSQRLSRPHQRPAAARGHQTKPEIKLDQKRTKASRSLQRTGINRLLNDIYRRERLLSKILGDGGFTHDEIISLRNERLNDFVTAVVQRWCAWFRRALSSEVAKILIEQYSLYGQPVPTLSASGIDLGLSKEQIGLLQQRGLRQLSWQSNKRRLEKLVCDAARVTLPAD